MSKVLIIAEHLDGKLNASTARCVTCAKDLKPDAIDVLVLAADVGGIAAEAAKIEGVAKVLTVARAENAHALAAVFAPQVGSSGEERLHAPARAVDDVRQGSRAARCRAARRRPGFRHHGRSKARTRSSGRSTPAMRS